MEATEASESCEKPIPTAEDLLECVAHECPELLRKGKTYMFIFFRTCYNG
jgi:hypothetical protein